MPDDDEPAVDRVAPTGNQLHWYSVAPHRVLALIAAEMRRDDAPKRGRQPVTENDESGTLGDITLTAAQRDAVARCGALLRREGGALLADAVGTGKTFIALALAHERGRTVVVAPAALRPMWRAAAARAGVRLAAVLALEAFGRRHRAPDAAERGPALVIVDEAHHARNRSTRRYAQLAALCARAPVLLLTATPIHNRTDDLRALLALFLGAAADGVDPDRYLVRRTAALGDGRPRVLPTVTLPVPRGDDLLDALVALPPPVPPSDGGDAGALAVLGLVRQWASSDGALRAAVVRRLTTAAAMEAALDDGSLPDAAALRRWVAGEGTVQLTLRGFGGGFVEPVLGGETLGTLAVSVAQHAAALRAVLARLDAAAVSPADAARAAHLAALVAAGRHVVAFSHAADTVRTLYRHLRNTPGVAMLTGTGARVAGGTLTRAETLARFAPAAQGARAPRQAETIRLLIASDLIAEGVNLQDADTVVHLDLPWTPARLVQRVGRVARAGSVHADVRVYALAIPTSARALLRIEQRLRAKANAAVQGFGLDRHAGVGADAAPGATRDERRDAIGLGGVIAGRADTIASPREALRVFLHRWANNADDPTDPDTRRDPPPPHEHGRIPLAAVQHPDAGGTLALVRLDGRASVVWLPTRGRPTTHPSTIVRVLGRLEHATTLAVDPAAAGAALDLVQAWIAHAQARSSLGGRAGESVLGARHPAVVTIVRRAARVVRQAPWHRRAILTPLTEQLRQLARGVLPAGAELALRELASVATPDESWLREAAAKAATLVVRGPRSTVRDAACSTLDATVLAVVLMRGAARERGASLARSASPSD